MRILSKNMAGANTIPVNRSVCDDKAMSLIDTKRLRLVPFTLPMLRAVEAGRLTELARMIGASVPPAWPSSDVRVFQVPHQIGFLEADADELPWHGRLIVLKGNPDALVGVVNLKGRVDARGRVEIGYEVDPPFRRRGIATEAVRGVMAWCMKQPGVKAMQARTMPGNRISAHMLARIGFNKLGPQRDPRLGELIVWELALR
jgi:RimJ/RimL family protein N-acetyltransferase